MPVSPYFTTGVNFGEKRELKTMTRFFDIAQGSYLGAELCELVGLFVLSELKDTFGAGNFGLYRDDCMAQLFCLQSRNIKKAETCLF